MHAGRLTRGFGGALIRLVALAFGPAFADLQGRVDAAPKLGPSDLVHLWTDGVGKGYSVEKHR